MAYFGPLGPNSPKIRTGVVGGGGAGVGPGGVKSGEMSLNCLFYWSSIHINTVCAHIGA